MRTLLFSQTRLKAIESAIARALEVELEKHDSSYNGEYSKIPDVTGSHPWSVYIEENIDPMWSFGDPIKEQFKYWDFREFEVVVFDRYDSIPLGFLSGCG